MTNHKRIFTSVVAMAAACMATLAHAKLPELSAEAKATAAAAASKAAWGNKLASYQLCKVQDKVVAHYLSEARSAGKDVKEAAPMPDCVDPGPFEVVEVKPIEASGAHSPPRTAHSPPSTEQPDAVANPTRKP